MFHIGQRVVCVDVSLSGHPLSDNDLDGLRKGCVYTVRGFGPPSWLDGSATVYVVEIARPKLTGDEKEAGYSVWRFRPVDETRLEVFRAMLVTPPRELSPVGDEDERRKVAGWEAA